MADIGIDCTQQGSGWLCRVTVRDAGTQTQHEVSISQEEMTRYGASTSSVVALVNEAFAFLLEREPKESILRQFALSDIERYFPEFGPS